MREGKRNLQAQSIISHSIDYSYYAGPIRHQGVCGSCYAFASVDAVSAIRQVNGCPYLMLSAQELVSFSGSYGNQGCSGGTLEGSYDYMQNNGILYDSSLPYTSQQFSSTTLYPTPSSHHKVSASLFYNRWNVGSGDCGYLQKLLSNLGPIPVGVSSYQMQFYSSGQFQSYSYQANHAALLIGVHPSYGFLIKNSWGWGWGSGGMMWLDTEMNAGICNAAVGF